MEVAGQFKSPNTRQPGKDERPKTQKFMVGLLTIGGGFTFLKPPVKIGGMIKLTDLFFV